MNSAAKTAGAALAAVLLGLPARPASADPQPVHHVNVPKPIPAAGDAKPFVVTGSSTAANAPTIAVIGDSVARDYAYYLSRALGPYARVVDGALAGCPAGNVKLIAAYYGLKGTPLRSGLCPAQVPDSQTTLIKEYSPKIVIWHSMNEIWDLVTPRGKAVAGSPEWRRAVLSSWDGTLRRITSGGAMVVVVLPVWPEHPHPGGPDVQRVRDLYTWWAARHGVTVVDPAPVVCPPGPPCGLTNGIDFRPDGTHFDDAGGMQVATYLTAEVPALLKLVGHRP